METSTKKIESSEQHNQEPLNGQFEDWKKEYVTGKAKMYNNTLPLNG